MDFDFTEDHLMLQQSLREFADEIERRSLTAEHAETAELMLIMNFFKIALRSLRALR